MAAVATFPEEPSSVIRELSTRLHTSLNVRVISSARYPTGSHSFPALCPVVHLADTHYSPRTLLPIGGVTSFGVMFSSPRSTLLNLHRSYWLMRRTRFLPATLFLLPPGLCRLLRAPAGRCCLPTLSPQSLRRRLDPYPAALLQCICPFLPARLRPHLCRERFGARSIPATQFQQGELSRLQSFRNVQAPTLARPPDCAHR